MHIKDRRQTFIFLRFLFKFELSSLNPHGSKFGLFLALASLDPASSNGQVCIVSVLYSSYDGYCVTYS